MTLLRHNIFAIVKICSQLELKKYIIRVHYRNNLPIPHTQKAPILYLEWFFANLENKMGFFCGSVYQPGIYIYIYIYIHNTNCCLLINSLIVLFLLLISLLIVSFLLLISLVIVSFLLLISLLLVFSCCWLAWCLYLSCCWLARYLYLSCCWLACCLYFPVVD